ncbi:hypothetical protein JTT01_18030 [Clostridium botulinum]|nr:hypothetical protein [Clostridium botulinum]
MSREQLLDILNNYATYNQYRIYVVLMHIKQKG